MNQDSTTRQLEVLCGRLHGLMHTDAQLNEPLDIVLGAIYALKRASELRYIDRQGALGQWYYNKVQELAMKASQGDEIKDSPWVAGFYFNSALLRIAAAYHQVLKLITVKNETVAKLRESIADKNKRMNLDSVHDEVNKIKHNITGVGPIRSVKMDQAVAAIEELLGLAEN